LITFHFSFKRGSLWWLRTCGKTLDLWSDFCAASWRANDVLPVSAVLSVVVDSVDLFMESCLLGSFVDRRNPQLLSVEVAERCFLLIDVEVAEKCSLRSPI